ncbi:TerD family protein, partial [Nocardia farcinica]|uniref:TerD family protein n=1 Tax=Nocardia farcinica TaxID=37329 RepID=UPI0024566A14
PPPPPPPGRPPATPRPTPRAAPAYPPPPLVPGGYPPPTQQMPPAAAGAYPPPGAGGYPPPPGAAQPSTQGEVSLSKDRPVSLQKGQRVTLRKEGGAALTFVKMGLGWDPVQTRGMFGNRTVDIDLDASVILFADANPADFAYYGQLSSKDGSVRHQGDNLTGEGEGDDEVILVDLTRIPAHITTLLFIVTSYKGHTFEQVRNAFCRLVDGANNAELARYTLAGGMPFTAMAMAKVFRAGGEWKLQALGEGFQAKHPGEAIPQLGRFL